MNIVAIKLTDSRLMQKACAVTMGKDTSKVSLLDMYACMHSPIRTQIFWVEMRDIKSFVSVHLVRHNVGVTHYVKSLRDDRCGNGNETRDSLVNHCMLINAESLISMARKRLCKQAHPETIAVMVAIRQAILTVDPDLYTFMVPECVYRNGCNELKPCGYWEYLIKEE